MNRWEERARRRKVEKLVAVLKKKHATLSQVAHVARDPLGRWATEGLAGVRAASDETWAQVVDAFKPRVVSDEIGATK